MTIFTAAFLLGMPLASEVTGEVRLANGALAKNAVVFFQGNRKSSPMKAEIIDQRDRTFIPHVKVVTAGTIVKFPNNDVVFHNVFAEYHNAKFDFGLYPRGKSKTFQFDKTGVAVLLCSIHPEMGAYVYCVDTPFFAVTDRQGRFKIKDVEEGEYEVRVWHETGETYRSRAHLSGSERLKLQTRR